MQLCMHCIPGTPGQHRSISVNRNALLRVSAAASCDFLQPRSQGNFTPNGHTCAHATCLENTAKTALLILLAQQVRPPQILPAALPKLVSTHAGQEIVVSAVGAAATAEQAKYMEAAKAAGVRRFVPAEFGLNTQAPGIRECVL